MYIPNFSFLAQFEEELLKKWEKWGNPTKKLLFLGLWGAEIGLKILDPQKVYLGLLKNGYTKFQLHSSIWRGDRKGTGLLHGQKAEKPPHFPIPIDLEGQFLDMLYHFEVSIGWFEKVRIFAFLTPQHPLSRIGVHHHSYAGCFVSIVSPSYHK